ncbi:polysaccharide deacetylase family protein [Pelobium sp.]|nr:polysaccharide deacetylase family protein [Pelobium sp.]MDA9555101.1 polysaccharide deacetylase family protein [Pelobium sp.]
MYLIKTPFLLKKLYPSSLVWNKSRKEKVIYLTFDDGPIPIVTPWVLKTLKNFNAKATFFCIGDNIQKHPEIFNQLKDDEHAIGNHTFNHLKGWITDDKTYIDNFNQCQALTQTSLFRPPYGRIKRSQIKLIENQVTSMEYQVARSEKQDNFINLDLNQKSQIIMWDVLSGDFDTLLSPEKCLKNVLKNTENGSIVVFHDSLKAWERLEYVLPKVLEIWSKQGYRFKTL